MQKERLTQKGNTDKPSKYPDAPKEIIEELKEARIALLNMLEDEGTARKEAEEERDKTSAIITNLADGLFLFDRENNLVLINPKAKEFLKVENQELIKKTITELLEISPLKPLIALLIGSPQDSIRSGRKKIKKTFKKELRVRDLVLEISTIFIESSEKTIGTLAILHNVTREKLVEKMKTEFVSIAAHQLRTPLSAIKWTLRMILDGDIGDITKEQRDLLEKTYKSNERMIVLINDLLNVTRIEEGKLLYKPVLSSLEILTQSVVKPLMSEAKKRDIKLKIVKPKEILPKVKVDAEKIQLAIQNLIENAIKYTPPHGTVTVSLKSDNGKVEFSVKDTGVGIPDDQQGRIFTKFFRGANVVRLDTEGTGLGLYTSKNIVEAHGGKIWFESEEKKGSVFYFTLPFF